ncbi:MAG: DUF2804 domain-containing protein [bacterium]
MSVTRREFVRLCAGAAALGATGASGFFNRALADPPVLDKSYEYYCPELVEITEPGPVILPDGACRCGWTRRPILELNFEDAKFSPSKQKIRQAMKKWDMYHLYTPEYGMSFLVAWIPYAAFFSANLYDRKTNRFYEDTRFLPPNPEIPMMRDSTGGKTVFESDRAKAIFEVDGEHHKIKVVFEEFPMTDKEKADININAPSGEKDRRTTYEIEADLLYPKDHDSIAGVHMTNPRRCHYGHKINCMTAEGAVTFDGRTSAMSRQSSFGALDFGRGHYPRKMFWYWATASGRAADGKLVGFNLGYGNSPGNLAENALFYDGRITKINAVACGVPSDAELMKPWSVRDEEGLVDLTFTPRKVRRIDVKVGSGHSIGRPSLGFYSGKLVTSSGRVIELKDLFGLYEWVDSKW